MNKNIMKRYSILCILMITRIRNIFLFCCMHFIIKTNCCCGGNWGEDFFFLCNS